VHLTDAPLGTLFYVHGLGESGLCFEGIISDERLTSWNHVVPDLSGYGRSLWPSKAIGLEGHVSTVRRLLTKKLARPVILIGHSMGGVVGQLLCETHPDLIEGFFNVEGNISYQDCTFSSRAASQCRDDFLTSGFNELKCWVYRQGAQTVPFRNYFASLMFADPETFHLNSCELVEVSKEETLADRLEGLSIPKRYIAGLDGGAGVRSLELLRQANTSRSLLEGAGHWPFIDNPEAFIEELLRFAIEVDTF
jgi:pimeloyl-ACP methyl ester carboxylesterase